MAKRIVERKCHQCKGAIVVDLNDVKNIIQYKKVYYHKDCFIERANEYINKSNRFSKSWQDALDNIDNHERQTIEKLSYGKPTDKLNDWLLDNYDIVTTPSNRFWSTIKELGNGMYRNKRCKPISVELLTEVWQSEQPYLDKTYAYNKTIGKHMEGEARLYYDLAIIIKKIPSFIKDKKKQEAVRAEIINNVSFDEIDMSRIGQGRQITRRDISDIADDLFVE